MDPELRGYLNQMKADFRTEMTEMKIELKAHTEMIETRLLSAFWQWAKTSDAKVVSKR